jgi:predicted Fe-Mo cluster-binding NifX family protein
MKICFPVKEIADLDSEVYGHFGSAPAFVLVDSLTEAVTVLENADQNHSHGKCNPVGALEGHKVEAVVVGGIGGGALMKLNGAGIRVYQAGGKTVRENIALLTARKLALFMPGHICSGHSGACAH